MDTMPIELQISNLRVEANAHRVKAAECDEKADELEEIKNDPIRRMQMEIDGLKDRIKELSDDEDTSDLGRMFSLPHGTKIVAANAHTAELFKAILNVM